MTHAELAERIRRVVDYCWQDEYHNFRDNPEGRAVHIFRDLVALTNWTEGGNARPEQYLPRGRRA